MHKYLIKTFVFNAIAVILAAILLVPDNLVLAQTTGQGNPAPTQNLLSVSTTYSTPMLKGVRFDPANPLKLEFIIDTANQGKVTKEESAKLIKYFLAGLTLPEDDLWVNLSPYESNRVAPESLSQTDLGKEMLEQDYLLKQLSASLTYPETKTGREYWQAAPASLAKIWITPDTAEVYEHNNAAFITASSMKLQTEKDDPAMQKLLPMITQDVNTGKNFANLRQIYNSLILAIWFKQKFKESFYKNYIDTRKINGIDLADKNIKEKIWAQYVSAFKQGAYDYTKSERGDASIAPGFTGKRSVPICGKITKRRYFSGGASFKTLRARTKVISKPSNIFRVANYLLGGLLVATITISASASKSYAGAADKKPSASACRLIVQEVSGISGIVGIKLPKGKNFDIYKVSGRNIYHIEFASESIQDAAFNRIAAFAEEPKHRGKVLNDKEMKQAGLDKTIGVGNDYSARQLAGFYTKADKNGVILNATEIAVRDKLVVAGIIARVEGKFIPLKNAAVISTAQNIESNGIEGYREEAIEHEYNHGLYFTDAWYRGQVRQLWQSLSPNLQRVILAILTAGQHYDPNDHDLITREFAAWFRNCDREVGRALRIPFDFYAIFSKLQMELRVIEDYMEIVPEYKDKPYPVVFSRVDISAEAADRFIEVIRMPRNMRANYYEEMIMTRTRGEEARENEVQELIKDPKILKGIQDAAERFRAGEGNNANNLDKGGQLRYPDGTIMLGEREPGICYNPPDSDFRWLLDEREGGKGEARDIARKGFKVIKVYMGSVEQMTQLAQVSEKIYKQYSIKTTVIFSPRFLRVVNDRVALSKALDEFVEKLARHPWIIVQIGNEENYYIQGGIFVGPGQPMPFNKQQYYAYYGEVISALKAKLRAVTPVGQKIKPILFGYGLQFGSEKAAEEMVEDIAYIRQMNLDALAVNMYLTPVQAYGLVVKYLHQALPGVAIVTGEFGWSSHNALPGQQHSINSAVWRQLGRSKVSAGGFLFSYHEKTASDTSSWYYDKKLGRAVDDPYDKKYGIKPDTAISGRYYDQSVQGVKKPDPVIFDQANFWLAASAPEENMTYLENFVHARMAEAKKQQSEKQQLIRSGKKLDDRTRSSFDSLNFAAAGLQYMGMVYLYQGDWEKLKACVGQLRELSLGEIYHDVERFWSPWENLKIQIKVISKISSSTALKEIEKILAQAEGSWKTLTPAVGVAAARLRNGGLDLTQKEFKIKTNGQMGTLLFPATPGAIEASPIADYDYLTFDVTDLKSITVSEAERFVGVAP